MSRDETSEAAQERERLDGLIAKHWPNRFAKANAGPRPAKKRNALRKQWIGMEAFANLRQQIPTHNAVIALTGRQFSAM